MRPPMSLSYKRKLISCINHAVSVDGLHEQIFLIVPRLLVIRCMSCVIGYRIDEPECAVFSSYKIGLVMIDCKNIVALRVQLVLIFLLT